VVEERTIRVSSIHSLSSFSTKKGGDLIMTIAIRDSQLTIIQPSGHINAANAAEFQRQLTAAVTSAPNAVLVDMHRVDSLDSAGLMSLICAFRLAQRLNRRFGICCVAASIQMIFELTRLDAAFEIYPNRDAFSALLERGEESVSLIA
jgi:anti-anti-sigma factor